MNINHRSLIKAVVILILFAFITPVSGLALNTSKEQTSSITVKDNVYTLVIADIYVDDDNTEGPWDGSEEHPYQYIQDGIDNANPGNVIYVFNGTYYEDISIYKTVSLIGENKDNTIIDGGGCCNVVEITTNEVIIAQFTIMNSGENPNNAGNRDVKI